MPIRSAAIAAIFMVGLAREGATQSVVSRAATALSSAAEARAKKKLTDRYDPIFRKYTKRYFGPTFDWHYFKAQGFAESGLQSGAVSYVGARGLMQLMPSTFREISTRRPEFQSIDDPEWNIAAGIMHDRYLWKLWTDRVSDDERHRFMFASYNAGEGTINRAVAAAQTKLGAPPRAWEPVELVAPTVTRWRYSETLGYVRRIDSAYSRLTSVQP
jgi:soluble lytic murein transglycosylase-like protein